MICFDLSLILVVKEYFYIQLFHLGVAGITKRGSTVDAVFDFCFFRRTVSENNLFRLETI